MPRHTSQRFSGAMPLPKYIYLQPSGSYRVAIPCLGVVRELGTFAALEYAAWERDRALHHLSPWLRTLPDDILPIELVNTARPPNARLNALVDRLRSTAPKPCAEGRVAPTESEAKESKAKGSCEASAKLTYLLQRHAAVIEEMRMVNTVASVEAAKGGWRGDHAKALMELKRELSTLEEQLDARRVLLA